MKDEEIIIIDRATIAAFLSLEKIHLTPFVQPDGRVAFRANGEKAYEALAKLQGDPSVPLLSYIQKLEAVRSIIFALKDSRKQPPEMG